MRIDRPTAEELVGGPAVVLEALLSDPAITKTTSVSIVAAMAVARKITERKATVFFMEQVETQIKDAYDLYVMLNGEYADCADRAARDNWEAGIDDVIEAVFEPYEKWVSADWFGRSVIDTRLHKPMKDDGRPPEPHVAATELALSFAKDAWRVLTHYHDDEDDKVKEKSTGQILSSVGVVRSDIEELLTERPVPTTTEAKEYAMRTMNEVMNKLHAALTQSGALDLPTRTELIPLFENACDDDDGLALSGITPLGGDMDDVEVLRMFAMSAEDAADDLADLLLAAPYDDFPASDNLRAVPPPPMGTPQDVAGQEMGDTDEDAEMLAMMGGGAPAPASLPPPPVLQIEQGAPPPPPAPKPPVQAAQTGMEVSPRVFQLMKEHIKAKDEDVGKMLGVSRQTYINYGKDNARAKYVPTPDQRTALVTLLETHRDGLNEALELLGVG